MITDSRQLHARLGVRDHEKRPAVGVAAMPPSAKEELGRGHAREPAENMRCAGMGCSEAERGGLRLRCG